MNEILKELADLIGFDRKELEDILSEGTVKVNVNGEPIINIENGVDKLSKKEEPKKEEPTSCTTTTSCPKESYYTSPNIEYNKSYANEEPVVEDKSVWLTKDLLMVDDNTFIAVNKIKDIRLADEQTEISFTHCTHDGWWSGITEEQLLRILLYRFKDDPVKSDLIKRLLTV